MIKWFETHEWVMVWSTILSIVIFLASLILVPLVAARIPADYFSHARRPPGLWSRRHWPLRWAIRIGKNTLGALLILAGIASLFLGEVIGARRGIATVVGFAGVLMITRPFGEGFEPWALVALSGAIFGSLVVMMIKLLSRTEPTMVIMFYFALFTTLFAFIPAVMTWQAPSWTQLALLVLCGVLGIVGQGLFTHGVGLGETSFVMPFDYLRIVYSFVIGFVWFAEVPGFWSFACAAVIIASSLYLLRTQGGKAPPGG